MFLLVKYVMDDVPIASPNHLATLIWMTRTWLGELEWAYSCMLRDLL